MYVPWPVAPPYRPEPPTTVNTPDSENVSRQVFLSNESFDVWALCQTFRSPLGKTNRSRLFETAMSLPRAWIGPLAMMTWGPVASLCRIRKCSVPEWVVPAEAAGAAPPTARSAALRAPMTM